MKRCFLVPSDDLDLAWLKGETKAEDTILPVGLKTLALCREFLPKVRSIEDFVPYEEIVRLATRANDLAQLAAEGFCKGETFDGYNWPKISWYAQLYFFRDVLLGEALASSLKGDGFETVFWVGEQGQNPGYYLSTADTVCSTLRCCLGNRLEILRPLSHSLGLPHGHFQRKIQHGLQRVQKFMFDRTPTISKCQVIAIFGATTEWERFTDALEEVGQEYGEEFQLWFLGRIPEKLREWISARKLKSISIPYPNTLDEDILSYFKNQWESWLIHLRYALAEEFGCKVLSSDLLQYHFAFYFNRLWPRLAQWGRRIEGYLNAAQPRWIIGSAAYSHETAIPYYVSAKSGISSIALPHAYIPGGHGRIKSSLLACRNRFERENFRRPFPDDRRVLYCRNAGNEISYTANPAQRSLKDGHPIVAVLTAEPDSADSFMLSVHRANFLDSLAGIISPR